MLVRELIVEDASKQRMLITKIRELDDVMSRKPTSWEDVHQGNRISWGDLEEVGIKRGDVPIHTYDDVYVTKDKVPTNDFEHTMPVVFFLSHPKFKDGHFLINTEGHGYARYVAFVMK